MRDTATVLKIRWQGRALFAELIRKCDRAGILDGIEDPIEDLSLITGIPEEHVKVGLGRLVKQGTVEINGDILFIPNFMPAQEASKSDKQRQRESRQRRRKDASYQEQVRNKVTKCDVLSQIDRSKPMGAQVDRSGHSLPSSALPSSALPSSALPRKEKNIKKRKSGPSPNFLDFWASWPASKIGRAAAWKRWELLRKSGVLPPVDKLKQALIQQDLARSASKATGGFVPPWPHPSTWLNEERWNDEIKVDTTQQQLSGQMTQQDKNMAILKAGREKRAAERLAEDQRMIKESKCEVIR